MTEPLFPFIVGVPRSGTTLLRAMLGSHPDLAIPEEATFLVAMSAKEGRYHGSEGFDLEGFVADLLRERTFHWWGLPEKEARCALRVAAPGSLADAMRSLHRYAAAKDGKTRFGNKTPLGLTALPRLARLFPEARFIHVIRDGRDVALSHVHTPSFIDDVGEVAVVWRDLVQQGMEGGGKLGPERYVEIRYERLVENPEPVLRSLCEYVELDFDPGMLRYFEHPMQALGATQQDLPFHASLYLPPTKGLRDWRRELSRKEISLFEALAGDLLDILGYERVNRTTRSGTRIRASEVRLRVALKKSVNRQIEKVRRWGRGLAP